ncbi:hypothetical protein Q6A91_08565 [Aliarcobacter skirrowii]|uniref:hypothetical protein n=1 Tax=Aliarcobacter skirrowii TaxID=28200 RepID=UPI0029AB7B60|nr:hypothetical protein [Aliarcobacter skirrowii]MDX4066069.1 hypothetical protein [Aliarcobacter skirrowii]
MIERICEQINFLEKSRGNKIWTLSGVYEVLSDNFERIKNQKSNTYNCIRVAIIDSLSKKYETKEESQNDLMIEIIISIDKCFKKYN